MPQAVCTTVYADTSTYPSSASNLARISLSSDTVFGDNSSAQLAQQTPTGDGPAELTGTSDTSTSDGATTLPASTGQAGTVAAAADIATGIAPDIASAVAH